MAMPQGMVVLKEVVQRIQQGLQRSCDWFARLGGDEFAVVLPQTDIAGASIVAEKLRRAVAATPIRLGTCESPYNHQHRGERAGRYR